MTTVIIPAHNEARVIGRLLRLLLSAARPGELEIIVVPNGCTDDTAEVAASFGPSVRVIAIPAASKHEALRAGDHAAKGFPRLYVDADVELQTEDVRALASALLNPGVLAAGPERVLPMSGVHWLVRWYYDIWTNLPEVRVGLFGRGVIAVSEAGHQRVAGLPALLSDDLAVALMFADGERIIVKDAQVVIYPPRTMGDLLRRRIRVATGVSQIEHDQSAPDSTAQTRLTDLLAIVRREPRMAPRVAVFAAVAAAARFRAAHAVRRGDHVTWHRDESSRQSPATHA